MVSKENMALTINPEIDNAGIAVLSQDTVDRIFNQTTEDSNDGKQRNQCLTLVTNCLNIIFPKVEPISSLNFFLLTFFAAIPTAIYFLAFTKIGFGLEVFFFLSENANQYGYWLGLILVPYAFLLYLFDCYYWGETGCYDIAKKLCITILVIGVSCVAILVSGDYPYNPICLYVVMIPLWMTIIGNIFYARVKLKRFVTWLSGPLFLLSCMVFTTWLVWILWNEDNEWNPTIGLAEADESGCEPDFSNHPNCRSIDGEGVCFTAFTSNASVHYPPGCDRSCSAVYDSCLNPFLLWCGPLFTSCGLLFLSYFATFLRVDGSGEQDVIKFAKLWLSLLFATWVYASLAGAATGISTALASLTFAGFIASAVFLAVSYTKMERETQYQQTWNIIAAKFGTWLDVARGLLVVTCLPIFIIFLIISFLKQRIRLCCNIANTPIESKSLKNVAGSEVFTVEFRRLIRVVQSWNKSKVFTYAIYWGILFMTLIVIVAKFTLLFLSWMIGETSELGLITVTLVLFGIGLFMFLLPPISGVPIYIVLGMVILPAGRDKLGIWGCFGYAVTVSLVLKLTACAIQQKLIGELLRNMVSIRRLCGINSTVVRATKLNLKEKGLGLAKVSILVGMPDWPTSVLCGIMGLPLIPILIGTLPVIVLIAPTLLIGFFTYMSNLKTPDDELEFPWAGTLAAITTATTAFVQFGAMIIAAFFVEKTTSTRADEIDAIPIDEEVRRFDEKGEAVAEMYQEVTKWDSVPQWAKACLISSLACMVFCCYMVQFFQDQCFTPYDLTFTIEEHLDGNWMNLVKPLGFVALSLFLLSLLLLCTYTSWATWESKKLVDSKNNDTADSKSFETNPALAVDNNIRE